jgi:hypothetical protein
MGLFFHQCQCHWACVYRKHIAYYKIDLVLTCATKVDVFTRLRESASFALDIPMEVAYLSLATPNNVLLWPLGLNTEQSSQARLFNRCGRRNP